MRAWSASRTCSGQGTLKQGARAIDAPRLAIFFQSDGKTGFQARASRVERAVRIVFLRIQSVSRPQQTESGLPDSVPAWYTGQSGASRSMILAGPAMTHRHSTANYFPEHDQVGAIPMLSAIEPKQRRNPVITSSQIKSAPLLCAISARALSEPGSGFTTPMLAAMGSMMTAATFSGAARIDLRPTGASYIAQPSSSRRATTERRRCGLTKVIAPNRRAPASNGCAHDSIRQLVMFVRPVAARASLSAVRPTRFPK